MVLGIRREVLPWRRELKGLYELVLVEDFVALSGPPPRSDVLDRLTAEHKIPALRIHFLEDVLIDEAFDVKLPHHELLSREIVTDERPVLMNFALGILGLRLVNGLILDVDEFPIQHSFV